MLSGLGPLSPLTRNPHLHSVRWGFNFFCETIFSAETDTEGIIDKIFSATAYPHVKQNELRAYFVIAVTL